jgi:hypothetical protein
VRQHALRVVAVQFDRPERDSGARVYVILKNRVVLTPMLHNEEDAKIYGYPRTPGHTALYSGYGSFVYERGTSFVLLHRLYTDRSTLWSLVLMAPDGRIVLGAKDQFWPKRE